MNSRTKKPISDKLGTEIPLAIVPYWNRAAEAKALIGTISEVINHLKQAEKDGDKLFVQVNIPAAINDLSKARSAISEAVPYAVCASCRGHPETQPKGQCRLCLGLGLISRWRWDRVPAEIKQMIEKGDESV